MKQQPHPDLELGLILLVSDRYSDSNDEFSRLLIINPNHKEAWFWKGIVTIFLGRNISEARLYWSKSGIVDIRSATEYTANTMQKLKWDTMLRYQASILSGYFYWRTIGVAEKTDSMKTIIDISVDDYMIINYIWCEFFINVSKQINPIGTSVNFVSFVIQQINHLKKEISTVKKHELDCQFREITTLLKNAILLDASQQDKAIDCFCNLSIIFAAKNQLVAAEQCLQQALSIDKIDNIANSYFKMADVALMYNDKERASLYIQKALQISPCKIKDAVSVYVDNIAFR